MRLVMELGRSSDGRFEGFLHPDSGAAPAEFSGILELLEVLERFLVQPDPQGVHHE
jgi:hypothetical protein